LASLSLLRATFHLISSRSSTVSRPSYSVMR
jgi:hypothetical protein